MMYLLTALIVSLQFFVLTVTPSYSAHGLAMNGKLAYPAKFIRFDYTSEDAKKGGKLILHDIGSFDKMNPFTLKGEAPYALETLIFDTLGVQSLDEPFSIYGLIAKDIELAENQLSVTYTIDENAKFSDGTKVTVNDIAYSLETLKGPDVHPFYPYYYQDISGSEIIDSSRIRFVFAKANRELAMIATQIPIFSRNSFEQDDSVTNKTNTLMTPPVGSGPYVVGKVIQGKSITYKRNLNYWASDHPTRKGLFNFDTIAVKYYKDKVVGLEAFKAGEFDALSVNIAKQWARDMTGARFTSGDIIKKLFPHSNNAGMQGFLMNTRRPVFQDRKVRQAVGLALDFEWTNASLFYGQYSRSNSFFSNSHLAAKGVPNGLELSYLLPYKAQLPEEVFTTTLKAPTTSSPNSRRKNLLLAKELLSSAGYVVESGKLVNSEGEQLSFTITLVSSAFERVMSAFVNNLEKLGINASYRTIDPTLYTEKIKSFDFDMIVASYGQSLSPGNEQRNFWHSEAADKLGSRNYAGIQSEPVDGLIEKIIYARTDKELTAACMALDRVLWYGYYLVPNWYMSGHRMAYHNKFSQPETLPLYYSSIEYLLTWWAKE